MKRTTLKDIAKALNTTIATVSRALHDNPEISDEMKNRVREVAKLYDYKPNSTALSLKFQKSYTFGVIFFTLNQYFTTQILSGLLQEATKNGYKLIVAESNYDPKKELELIQEFYELNVDGILILPSRKLNTKRFELENIIRDDVPFVIIDRTIYFEKKKIPFITSDDYVGTREGISHLIKKGYKRFAQIKGLDSSSISNIRYQAFLETLTRHKLEIDHRKIISCQEFTKEEGEELANQLMSLEDKPDVIFCISDMVAVGVLHALRKKGYRVPEDVAVLGFSNSNICEVCTPQLSTIHQPGVEMGKKSIKLILSNIKQKKDISDVKIVMKTKLIEREST
ncbi:substrate-binding domain-containing protein [Marinifilum caeruleilacunae]|uniref:LacI family transcriptional regulator n=1 Tax=Marinifilum caeruleilacunae TaxID=2499076 RepID=A0ABX1WW64_9BACT|nr:LacI family transcriptional regulator [Marinifilum caeruleilacunae]